MQSIKIVRRSFTVALLTAFAVLSAMPVAFARVDVRDSFPYNAPPVAPGSTQGTSSAAGSEMVLSIGAGVVAVALVVGLVALTVNLRHHRRLAH